MIYRWLNFHLPYACQHSGACCSAGWPIPVEDEHVRQIDRAIAANQVRPLITPWRTKEGALANLEDGRCAFFRLPTSVSSRQVSSPDKRHLPTSGCSVYSSRPESCRHFPYVCLIDARGVSVSLSHYCPTAASLLFEHDGPIEIVEGPAPVAGMEIPEGLDARDALPPRESDTRLMGFDDLSRWEAAQIEAIDCSSWGAFAPVVERYLAAKLFASWAVYQQDDGIAAALDLVKRAETLLETNLSGRLDAVSLKDAIRQTDLFLVHSATT